MRGQTISQTTIGAKIRVLGDAIIDQDRWWPQVAVGAQWKHNGNYGFGGDLGGYHLMAEGSLGVFLTDNLVLGGEYRVKPDNLSAFREQDFKDAFLAWFICKYLSITGAWTFLGNIADKPAQQGLYLSIQASW